MAPEEIRYRVAVEAILDRARARWAGAAAAGSPAPAEAGSRQGPADRQVPDDDLEDRSWMR